MDNAKLSFRSLLASCVVGVIGIVLIVAAVAGSLDWPRLLLLAIGVTLAWSSMLLGPVVLKWATAKRGQIKHPWWLPAPLRPTPRRLADARRFTRQALGRRWNEANQIAGWLHPDQAAGLCHLARICPDGPIVEIGSFRGKSTVFLARGMKPSNTLTAIDPHIMTPEGKSKKHWARKPGSATKPIGGQNGNTSWNAFNRTLRDWNIAEKVDVVKDFSYNFRSQWDEPIALLWIDGDHRYESVRRDIEDWVDLVMPGGFLAFHDTHPRHGRLKRGDVRKAIMDTGVLRERGFESFLELRNAWFMQKRA